MKIFSLIVTYNPDIDRLYKLKATLLKSGSEVIIIDNTGNSSNNLFKDFLDCKIILQDINKGLAYAQNIGVKYALNKLADVIILFDQDAYVNDNYLSVLLNSMKIDKPMVLGACIIDENTNEEISSFVFNRIYIPRKIYVNSKSEKTSVDLVISSGTAINAKVFQKVGFFDEDLFIDFVDFEWSIRCGIKDIQIYVIPQAKLFHKLGNNKNRIRYFSMTIHDPERIYYQIRNSFLLLRKRYIPFMYSLYVIVTSLIHKFFVMILSKNKKQYLRSYVRGFIDGLLGKSGPGKNTNSN